MVLSPSMEPSLKRVTSKASPHSYYACCDLALPEIGIVRFLVHGMRGTSHRAGTVAVKPRFWKLTLHVGYPLPQFPPMGGKRTFEELLPRGRSSGLSRRETLRRRLGAICSNLSKQSPYIHLNEP